MSVAIINARHDRWAAAYYAAAMAGDDSRAARIKRLWNERNRRAVFGLPRVAVAQMREAA